MSTPRFLVILAVIAIGFCLWRFGTVSPCGILRETVRQRDGLAAILPDSWVDAAMSAQYGALSPGRCIEILMGTGNVPVAQRSPSPPVQPPPAPSVQPQNQPQPQGDLSQVAAAVEECKRKRLSGQLKTYVASANCSNPRILEIYRAAHYPYMDLVAQLVTRRLEISERIDAGKITEEQAQTEFNSLLAFLRIVEEARRAAGHQ